MANELRGISVHEVNVVNVTIWQYRLIITQWRERSRHLQLISLMESEPRDVRLINSQLRSLMCSSNFITKKHVQF